MIHAQVFRAGDIPGCPEVDTLSIVAEVPIADDLTREQSIAVFARDAGLVANALWETLPGGTIDALIGMLLAKRASLLHVPMPNTGDRIEAGAVRVVRHRTLGEAITP